MRFERACIPLGGAWSSPFARWQGPLSDISSIELAAIVTRSALTQRGVDPADISQIVHGWTIPQWGGFCGAPGIAHKIGAPHVTGPMISQACATGAAVIATAGLAVETGDEGIQLAVNADRVSNGPHIVFPQPKGPGGTVVAEDWVMDNFNRDAWFGHSMLQSAEYVAADAGASRQELDDVTFLRYEQYRRSLEDDRAFQRRYMVPVELPGKRGETLRVDSDHGIHDTTLEGLQRLEPVLADGVTTYGSQTHPADGAAGAIVTTEDRARALGDGEGIVRLLAYGLARVETARMPKAPVPAAERALRDAGLTFADVDAVTTHNPFTINDIWFARQTGIAVEDVNLYGSSLVFGHPHAATGNRLIAELIETLRLRGGGIGLFTGCAAGDSGAALVLRVDG